MNGEAILRKEVIDRVRQIVVKVGSSVVDLPELGQILGWFQALADGVDDARKRRMDVVLVSSGAVAFGMRQLKWDTRPTKLPDLQAAASVGQSHLMHFYETVFRKLEIPVAQVLLTHEDIKNRNRYLNARATLQRLLSLGVVPVINENDAISSEEIRFGDNDTLSALVVQLIEADLLIILTDTDGLHSGDPRTDKSAGRIAVVWDKNREGWVDRHKGILRQLQPWEYEKAGLASSGAHGPKSLGGMATKVEAARKAAMIGANTIVANGASGEHILSRILRGEPLGTLFLAGRRLRGKKRWIALALRPTGSLIVDDGALKAIQAGGKSLLPAGIVQVEGSFEAGSAVAVRDRRGREVARGLAAYGAEDLRRIRGTKSAEIEARLGRPGPSEVIHRDDLVLL